MNQIPKYLFDKIILFNDPIDIINMKKINKYYNYLIIELTNNNNSFLQKTYNFTKPIDNIITWIQNTDFLYFKYKKIYKIFLRNIILNEYQDLFYIFNKLKYLFYISNQNDKKEILIIIINIINNNFIFFDEKLFNNDICDINEKYLFINYLLNLFDMYYTINILKYKYYNNDNNIISYNFSITINKIFKIIKKNKSYFNIFVNLSCNFKNYVHILNLLYQNKIYLV